MVPLCDWFERFQICLQYSGKAAYWAAYFCTVGRITLRGQLMILNLETMPIDDLWQLYEQIKRLLAEQLTSEKRKLEDRLTELPPRRAGSVGTAATTLS